MIDEIYTLMAQLSATGIVLALAAITNHLSFRQMSRLPSWVENLKKMSVDQPPDFSFHHKEVHI